MADYTPNLAAQMVQNQSDSAMNTKPSDIQRGLLAGTEAADEMVNRKDNFDQGLAMNPMSDAIRSKYSQAYNMDKASLQRDTRLEARNSYFQKLQTASDLVAKEQQMNHMKQMAAYQAKRDKQKARSALVGQVLGIGGMAAGMAMGGPVGGMAGGAIGQGVGQQAGGG